MIAALLLGREGSQGFPGKNTTPVLGRPLMEYPLLAAQESQEVDDIYISTDSEAIKAIGRKSGESLLTGHRSCARPRHLARTLLSTVTG